MSSACVWLHHRYRQLIWFTSFAASVVMQVKYGYQVAPRHDRLVALTESTVEMLTGAVDRRGQLVNAFPARTSVSPRPLFKSS